MDKRPLTGVLLAGGKSSRMGKDKAFIPYNGKELFQYSLEKLEFLCDEIIISANNDRFDESGFRVIRDKYQDIGPLGGIYSCLPESKYENILVLGCDIPHISIEYINRIIVSGFGHPVCMGCDPTGKPQAMICMFNISILPFIKTNIEKGNYKLTSLLDHPGSLLLPASGSNTAYSRDFLNINSPEDLKQ